MKTTAIKHDKKGIAQDGKESSGSVKSEVTGGCRNIFIDELKEIYFAEKALLLSIPIMIKKAATKEVVDSLITHYEFTKEHINRLEGIFSSIGESQIISKYAAMYGPINPLEKK
jgi:ferritin-like metal-binding protein YciE